MEEKSLKSKKNHLRLYERCLKVIFVFLVMFSCSLVTESLFSLDHLEINIRKAFKMRNIGCSVHLDSEIP